MAKAKGRVEDPRLLRGRRLCDRPPDFGAQSQPDPWLSSGLDIGKVVGTWGFFRLAGLLGFMGVGGIKESSSLQVFFFKMRIYRRPCAV